MVKPAEPEDPMALHGVALPGNTEAAMAKTFVEELVRMGASDTAILKVFGNPFYAGAHAVFRRRGEAYVTDLINRVRAAWAPKEVKNG